MRKSSLRSIGRSLLAIVLLCVAIMTKAVEQGEGEFVSRSTLPILGDEFHTSCKIHSGYNFTMIHCADQFEVYDT